VVALRPGAENTRLAVPAQTGQSYETGAVPIASLTSKGPQRLQEYS
jgi:hypothetical protein